MMNTSETADALGRLAIACQSGRATWADWAERARVMVDGGFLNNALESFEGALSFGDAPESILVEMAHVELDLELFERCLETVAGLLGRSNEFPRAVLLAAKACLELGSTTRGIGIIGDPRELGDWCAFGWLLKGRLELKQEAIQQALESLEKAVATDGELADAWAWLAVARRLSSNLDGAIEACRISLRLEPGSPRFLCEYARSLIELRRFVEAEEALTGVLENDPSHRRALDYLVLGYLRGDNATLAIGASEAYLDKYPRDCGILTLRGMAAALLDLSDHALDCYGRALEANPLHAEAHFHRGTLRLEKGDSGGLDDLRRAQGLLPENSQYADAIEKWRMS